MSGEGSGHGAGDASRWELLADYASGALDGTPEADRVAARIAADPEWATAHHELLAADARLREELAGLAGLAADEAAPADLFDRLDAALAESAESAVAESAVAESAVAGSVGAGSVGAGSTGAGDAAPDAGGGRLAEVRSLDEARRHRFRMLSAAAAVVVVLAGVGGVIGLVNTGSRVSNTSGATAEGGAPAGSPTSTERAMGPQMDKATPSGGDQHVASAGPVRLEATGTDYQPATLPTVLRAVPTSEAVPQQPDGTPTLPPGSAARVPAELSRLTGGAALDSCLTALDGGFGARPVLVDYARFRGSAALVTVIPTAAAGSPWLVVAGPHCGTGDADVRYQRHAS